MAHIWNERYRYLNWLKIETAVCAELANSTSKNPAVISKKEWLTLKKRLDKLIKSGGVTVERVHHHEKITKHDVIAFTTAVAEKVGPLSRYVHFGLTSSDVVDTAMSMQIQEAGKVLIQDIKLLLVRLKKMALKYQGVATIGRSHGIFAEPTSFGLKFLGWYAEWWRNGKRLESSLEALRVGKLSGAVGVNAHFGVKVETRILKQLGLKREPVSTQVLPRDRHAEFLNVLAICGGSLERMAVELRHLQRSEVGEVIEGFAKGQKGSSAMPHKRNPISSENLTGSARLLRSYASAALENICLWHERDISHSSVERVIFPDSTILLDYALNRMLGTLNRLQVDLVRVNANLDHAGPTVFSGHYLLALVKAGVKREQAYKWVQECALAEGSRSEFVKRLEGHPSIKKYLNTKKIQELGSNDYQLRHVKDIYREVLKL
jgi:adenylosuccinate lyase